MNSVRGTQNRIRKEAQLARDVGLEDQRVYMTDNRHFISHMLTQCREGIIGTAPGRRKQQESDDRDEDE